VSHHVNCSAGRAATPGSFGLGPGGVARCVVAGERQAHGRGPRRLGRVYQESRKRRGLDQIDPRP
jgi:hypothetical protein